MRASSTSPKPHLKRFCFLDTPFCLTDALVYFLDTLASFLDTPHYGVCRKEADIARLLDITEAALKEVSYYYS